MSVSQPPVLKKVTEPSDSEILQTLQNINSEAIKSSKKLTTLDKSIKGLETSSDSKTEKRPKEKTFKEEIISKKEKVSKNIPVEEDDNKGTIIGEKIGESIREAFDSREFRGVFDYAAKGLLGPLNLVLDPIMDTFGISFSNMFDESKNPKSRGKKVKPTDSDIKQANPETFWLMKKLTNTKDNIVGGAKGLMDKLFGGTKIGAAAASLFPALAKALPIAAIAGGVIWGVMDAISAVGKAEKWGTSKAIAGVSGFFAGSGDGGYDDAFKNAGKWALMGAGIGFVAGGPVGALAGGLLGAALGAVFGFIGGENIAKGLQSVKDKIGDLMANGDMVDKSVGVAVVVQDSVNQGLATFASTIPKMIAGIFIKDKTKLNKLGDTFRDVFKVILEVINPANWMRNIMQTVLNVKNIFKDKTLSKDKKIKDIIKQVLLTPFQGLLKIEMIQNMLKSDVGKKITSAVSSIFDKTFEALKNPKETAKGMYNAIPDFVDGIFRGMSSSITNFFSTNSFIKTIKENIVEPILNFFRGITDMFEFISSKGIIGITKLLATGDFDKELGDFKTVKQEQRIKDSDEYKSLEKDLALKERMGGLKNKQEILDNFIKDKIKVNDAIITPNGRIIQPSAQDTIIATKSPVTRAKPFDNEVQFDIETISKSFEKSSRSNEVVEALKQIVSEIKNKPFNNVIQNNEIRQVDFDKLRFAL